MANCQYRWAVSLGVAATVLKNLRPARRMIEPLRAPAAPGISVIIPSRQGRHLLERMLALVEADLGCGEILVIDNGSSDGTAEYLQRAHPSVHVEVHPEPLSFARAANRGATLAGHELLCLLNNDMEIEPGFFRALTKPFEADPCLFCSSAQIFFPNGARREETGKTGVRRPYQLTPDDYPVFCPEPLEGEDSSPVLYGSGGCSLYDRHKFLALGGFDEFYAPAYVEDLDLGYRAWLHGWRSIYVAGARVLHRHRATSSRFYTPDELQEFLDRNHGRFLLRATQSLDVFLPYYRHATLRRPLTDVAEVFRAASRPRVRPARSEREILDLTGGAVRVFPGSAPVRGRRILFSTRASRPDPSRVDELTASAAVFCLSYSRSGARPSPELLASCCAVILVDGPAGEGPYWAALEDTRRRYSIEEIVSV